MDKKLDISSLKKAYNLNILNYDKEIESNNQNNIFHSKESARVAVI
jgi:hypothetical protein